ncbi:penicillin-binding transpeptidase domain-containing protein [Enteractinococcus fodinae]|uniref:Peptidoglycan glycosyltransferase n=1 Tax=Enteractinococcus fodinae TaxID=684663 RepID=A0ABU2B3K1_9MICC|nr:penicillin-binding transpeptidase domain-containing protein [Enteractinococcus fodinae]MDR7348177.1 peptidoglycan glycosyltransferase [Enteractinococcus fodinae]
MNESIRYAWFGIVAAFLVLVGAASYVQVIGADDLRTHEANSRELYKQFGGPRGPILVDGDPIAESVPSESTSFDYQRVYHDPNLYSGLTGFYSLAYGQTGLEQRLNDWLSGSADDLFIERLRQTFTGAENPGASVELTIDPQLQEVAYNALPEGIEGSVVVSEPDTGRILAMVARPSYDTNLLAVHSTTQASENMDEIVESGVSPYQNRPTYDIAQPGSTFKLIDAIAMLESGEYSPGGSIPVPNELPLPQTNNTISNFRGGICDRRDSADFTWIFAQSCNTPFSQAAMDLGQDAILDVAERFGFNDDSINIPLSVTASHFPTEDIHDATLAQSVLGQVDVRATALQMNMVAAGIANDGTVMHPQLVDTVRGPDLNVLEETQPEVYSEAITPDVAEDMTTMMLEVVQSGTAMPARSSIPIAAKTGTADIGETGKVNSWITGFAPADDPQVAVTLVYQNTDYSVGSQLTATNLKTIVEAVVEQ